MKYQNNKDLAGCLSLFHFIIRNNVLYLFAFVRSQHFKNSFLYDNQTYMLMTQVLSTKLKQKNIKIKSEIINIHITSLHQEKE